MRKSISITIVMVFTLASGFFGTYSHYHAGTDQDKAQDSSEFVIEPQVDVNLNILRDFEGYSKRPYWPGGASGPTVGIGIDLGNAGHDNIKRIFQGLVNKNVLVALLSASKTRGAASQSWILDHGDIELTDDVVDKAFRRMCWIYWNDAVSVYGNRLQTLDHTVKGVILSLVVHHGPHSSDLSFIKKYLDDHNAVAFAMSIEAMEARTSRPALAAAFKKRRRSESEVVMLAVSYRRNSHTEVYSD